MQKQSEWEYEYRKLYVMLPIDVFNELRNRELLPQIDAVVTHLLKEYLEG